jgi:mRNA interferase RelE/StbE
VTESIAVLKTSRFRKAYKKLHNLQKDRVDEAIAVIVAHPERGEAKRGDLAGVYVYKFDCIGQQFLLAYEWSPTTRILCAVGVHENFYRDLKRSTQ